MGPIMDIFLSKDMKPIMYPAPTDPDSDIHYQSVNNHLAQELAQEQLDGSHP